MEKSEKDQRIKKLKGLYVIVDPEHIQDRPLYEMCELIASAGADIIQLRNKNNDSVKLLKHTQIINSICRKHQTLFILNDHCDLARIAKTDGVHIGRTDLPIGEAKNILNESQIIGNSNATIQEIEQSSKLGADYIAVGAIFFSQTNLILVFPIDSIELARILPILPNPIIPKFTIRLITPVGYNGTKMSFFFSGQ